MKLREDVRHLELFADAPDAEIDWMLANGEIVTLPSGAIFFQQDEDVEAFYVTLEGEMQVTRDYNGLSQVMGTTPPGIIGGEMSLLMAQPSLTSAQAIMETRLLVFDRDDFQRIFAHAPTIGARILQVATQRLSSVSRQISQKEKQAALGRLSAGLAHELNNPASAARRSAQMLRDLLPALQHYTLSLNMYELSAEQAEALITFQVEVLDRKGESLTILDRSDCEEELARWLEDIGVEDSYNLAIGFVDHGVTREDIAELSECLHTEMIIPVLNWLNTAISARTLMEEIDGSTHRISKLVDAVKSYTFMDQGEFQNVDIHEGLETTLVLLHKRLGERVVVRHFGEAMPTIVGRGSELNEVWTNLLDNAIDATPPTGRISVVTRRENQHIMVEINDDGHGIPSEVLPQVFEPFFTTKPLGEGVGLGLEICNRIIMQHQGTIEIQSRPGQTRVIVRLPVRQLQR